MGIDPRSRSKSLRLTSQQAKLFRTRQFFLAQVLQHWTTDLNWPGFKSHKENAFSLKSFKNWVLLWCQWLTTKFWALFVYLETLYLREIQSPLVGRINCSLAPNHHRDPNPCQQHLQFRSSHPSKWCPSPMLLSLGVQMATGISTMARLLANVES